MRTYSAIAAMLSLLFSGCMSTSDGGFQSTGTTSNATTIGGSSASGSGSGGTTSGGPSVQIGWTAAAGAPTGYTVEQSTDGLIFTAATTSALTSTSATITGLSAGTKYYFRVQAYNAGGASGYSAVITASIP